MSSGVVLGASAALCWGVVDVAIAVLARRAPFVSVTAVVQSASLALLAGLAVALGDAPELSAGQWAAVAALGPIGVAAYLAFYKALQLGPIAIVSPIASANGAVVLVLAVVLLGDSLSATQAVGASLVVCCVVLAPSSWESACRRAPPTATGSGWPSWLPRCSAAICSHSWHWPSRSAGSCRSC